MDDLLSIFGVWETKYFHMEGAKEVRMRMFSIRNYLLAHNSPTRMRTIETEPVIC